MNFNALHQQTRPLLLANAWDVPSAKAVEASGYQAIGTSSAAIANMLGYADGENMSFEELVYIIKRIKASTTLPLSVDFEAGYTRDNDQVVKHFETLVSLGVVGVNLEDSIVTDGTRTLEDATRFAERLKRIKDHLAAKGLDIFINARIDVFILKHADGVKEACRRASLYEQAGADGIFVPYIATEADITSVVECTKLPINILANPSLPDIEGLTELGVRRISMGNKPFDQMCSTYQAGIARINTEQSLTSLFA
ncbi:MAG: isocitrate lyase/phosphoenolpyruvate mutase family protein [Saprospiraceae bacterium]